MGELEVKHSGFASRLLEVMRSRDFDKVRLSEESNINYEMIRRYCEGLAKPRDKNLKVIAEILQVAPSYLSYAELPEKQAIDKHTPAEVKNKKASNQVSPTKSGYIIIGGASDYPLVDIKYLDIKASCGNGYVNLEHPDSHTQAFTVEFLRDNDLPIDGHGLVLMHACSDSMGYTIPHGTLMLVNTNESEYDNFINNKIYVFNADGEMMCKRTIKNLDGTVILKSDNTDRDTYPDQLITRDTFNQFALFGRVRYSFLKH